MGRRRRPADHRSSNWAAVLCAAAVLMTLSCSAHAYAPAMVSFADMSLEELANVEVTSVSRKAERLADAAASVYVIMAEDIRHAGVATLPDALRLAPNLHVAQRNGAGYSISARGLNGSNTSTADKLLVLIDGRSVYSPLFSGVFWDVQDVMLEDVERIEVISGPGGTLWGVNAVNGVINIITRATKDTHGTLIGVTAGNRGTNTAFRYGGATGGDGNFRVYGKYSDSDHTTKDDGGAEDDAWHKAQIGFRADWRGARDKFTVHGNAYRASIGQPEPGLLSVDGVDLELDTITATGVNLTSNWAHTLDGGSSLSFQAYYDRTERTIPPAFNQTLDIIDLQFQHALQPIASHALTWGANYRYSMDRVDNNSDVVAFLPADVNQKWSSLFAQDEITLREDLRLTLGARIERNVYTGNEFLPSARLAWKFKPEHLLWTAASRTVRAPSRIDADAHIPGVLAGSPNVRSEVAKVFELGYRGQPNTRLSYSVTAFHTIYDDLRSTEIAPTIFTPGGPQVVFGNEMDGTATGLEMWGSYQMSPRWRVSAGYTALDEDLRLKPSELLPAAHAGTNPSIEGRNPSHTWQLRSNWNIAENQELDFAIRHVAALSGPDVPAYTAIDARYGWKVHPDLELAVVGQNLFGTDHAEFGNRATRVEIPTSVFVRLLWQY